VPIRLPPPRVWRSDGDLQQDESARGDVADVVAASLYTCGGSAEGSWLLTRFDPFVGGLGRAFVRFNSKSESLSGRLATFAKSAQDLAIAESSDRYSGCLAICAKHKHSNE
jgi:hypothetical protein